MVKVIPVYVKLDKKKLGVEDHLEVGQQISSNAPPLRSDSSSAALKAPPPNFPNTVQYITQPQPSKRLPIHHRQTYCAASSIPPPNPPPKLQIKSITDTKHPAFAQSGLFALQKLPPRSWIRDYLGIVHTEVEVDAQSDYDLCLLRQLNPDGSLEIIGIDATQSGNEARFVNDYRGVLDKPNAEFELRKWVTSQGKEAIRMSVWAGPKGVEKGSEICVSYGRGFWDGRK